MLIYYRLKYVHDLTRTEEVIRDYLSAHMEECARMSQNELAESTYASPSAISRFVRKLGFDSYKQFQLQLVRETGDQPPRDAFVDYNFPFFWSNTDPQVAANIAELYKDAVDRTLALISPERLSRVVDLLYECEFVDMYAVTNNVHTALNFQDKMLTIGRYVSVSIISQTQKYKALASDSHHIGIVISYSGVTPEMVDIAKILKKNNTPIIFIGAVGNHEIARMAEECLFVMDQEDVNVKISYFASHIATQYVLDCVFGCIFKKDYMENMDYHLNMYNTLDPRTRSEPEKKEKTRPDS